MIRTRIEDGFRISLPESVRKQFQVGETVLIETDDHGRIVIVPAETVLAILSDTFGMRQDSNTIDEVGIHYMDRIRQGSRIDEVD